MLTLGIESSCDDTAAAVLRDDGCLLSSVLSSQDQIHTRFGGIVPELASRSHLESIVPIVNEALGQASVTLEDIDLIACTQGPGLIGSLLVGFSYAKALSYVTKTPCVGVDHMAGHILSIFLEEDHPDFPFIALVVSGGTSSIYLAESFTSFTLLGRTRDDAAGEAFDKVAKLLGFPYPGGPIISREAQSGNPEAIKFPRSWLEKGSLDFSFSGLKTAVLNHCNTQKQKNNPLVLPDICASFQEAVVDVLVGKTLLAANQQNIQTIVLGGGVSSNPRLRQVMEERCPDDKKKLFIPRPVYCTDNGAMIALAGMHAHRHESDFSFDRDVYCRSLLA
ncbi:MAG: tRNA (adenosine(37)-N6)-threonylcarbamoyltransferase complex transferase subunit TsaD [Desulfocapsa sp.]|nr:tRNA (adenosine(37)-N6)-threonylcarbamoyltransferase complex transferase subunit TsaD [Desulfocapsa sp.]